ncbi:unnamed protein product [Lepidochelys olivacea]
MAIQALSVLCSSSLWTACAFPSSGRADEFGSQWAPFIPYIPLAEHTLQTSRGRKFANSKDVVEYASATPHCARGLEQAGAAPMGLQGSGAHRLPKWNGTGRGWGRQGAYPGPGAHPYHPGAAQGSMSSS